MPRKFVPFGKLEPSVMFDIHELTWVKCDGSRQYDDIVFNAYSLDNTTLDARNRGTVEVRFFDNATLVEVDPERPPTKQYIEVLPIFDNDN
jgi:hypothetical protein